ncbi:MAG: Holliday junction resolvase RuvX [Bacteroidia bacterium]
MVKGRILAIDYGNKRIGLAVTDSLQIIAGPLKTVHSQEILSFLKEYVPKEKVVEIVIGEPKHMDGTESGPIEALSNFKKALERFFPEIPIHMVDERFTSKMAMASLHQSGASKTKKKNKEEIDLISAVLILQSHMERNNFLKH